ncbi:hypothetical protein [uncultured Tateyamaria sp.]|uniref:hypothetical protein n=1 Tax=uncultured Tateyamaria sp. TaxID=455651 RepID=UPI0026137247|nr:hypothetical protein [uncultured Tateyamaria sp.]
MSYEVAFTAILLVSLGFCIGILSALNVTRGTPGSLPVEEVQAEQSLKFAGVFLIGLSAALVQSVYLGFQFKNDWNTNTYFAQFLYMLSIGYAAFVALLMLGRWRRRISLAAYIGHVSLSAILIILGSACMFVVFGLVHTREEGPV